LWESFRSARRMHDNRRQFAKCHILVCVALEEQTERCRWLVKSRFVVFALIETESSPRACVLQQSEKSFQEKPAPIAAY
jgi:hypothetical protein